MQILGGIRYNDSGLILALKYILNLFCNENPDLLKKKKNDLSKLFRDSCPIFLKEHQQKITTLQHYFSPSCSFLLHCHFFYILASLANF